ncbi:aminotransferase [Tistrella bauzanensis]|uniref:aminotransferase n=1 Tax=Tistrella bauzanensis TaxID=657419 RepID=UPI00166DE290|nr:aminotransferase [Tistrella bauzanensis]
MQFANQILSGYGTTIFTVMSALAQEHGAVNLGQGFPDWEGPEEVRRIAAEGLMNGYNQYPPMAGIPELRRAVAAHDRRFYGMDVDPMREVIITSGATEALAAALLGLLNPGDEVVLIEPLYDSYLPIVQLAGAVPRLVRVEPPLWDLPRAALAAAFGPKTRMLVMNSPMNPTGKVFSDDDLAFIADLVKAHDAIAVCDEVHEHLVFDGRRHTPLMTLPGMRERTVRIGSAGKTFSLTGWKVGYLVADAPIAAALGRAHQFLTFTTPPNLQQAVAHGLSMDRSYFDDLAAGLAAKRDLLSDGLRRVGFDVLKADGTYFIGADIRPLVGEMDDAEFSRRLTIEAGVTCLPFSAFYQAGDIRNFVRFCFCKRESVLEEAVGRLERFFAAGGFTRADVQTAAVGA